MPISTRVGGLAASLHGRFRRQTGGAEPANQAATPGVQAESPALVPAPLDAAFEALQEAFRQQIIAHWTQPEQRAFLESDLNHCRRYALSLSWLPEGEGLLLDPAHGAGHFTEVLRSRSRYRVETPAYFNLENSPVPYPDATFDGVLLMEVLEHFASDPMFAMAELNRVLKPGGFLFLTTPNLASWRALYAAIHQDSPYLYGLYLRNGSTNRHNREYTVREVGRLAEAAGFRVERLEGLGAYPAHDALPLIAGVDPRDRGDSVFCLARKQGPVVDRYPSWLYV
jgi:SAM-dependent methyltransferase